MTIHEYIKLFPKKAKCSIVDGKINADGDVRIVLKHLIDGKFPFPFGVVKGNFVCSEKRLTSLKGSPKRVGGRFDCSYNQLICIEGLPKEIGGDVIISFKPNNKQQ